MVLLYKQIGIERCTWVFLRGRQRLQIVKSEGVYYPGKFQTREFIRKFDTYLKAYNYLQNGKF